MKRKLIREFDLAFTHIARLAGLAEHIHPSEAFCATPDDASQLLANICGVRRPCSSSIRDAWAAIRNGLAVVRYGVNSTGRVVGETNVAGRAAAR